MIFKSTPSIPVNGDNLASLGTTEYCRSFHMGVFRGVLWWYMSLTKKVNGDTGAIAPCAICANEQQIVVSNIPSTHTLPGVDRHITVIRTAGRIPSVVR
jgi:hypothetical protein